MITSESVCKVSAALLAAQRSIKDPVKAETNTFFKSKYADLGAVLEACRAALLPQGITFHQWTADGEKGIVVHTRLQHDSGEYMVFSSCSFPATKPDAHGVASAITYGRRYALLGIMGICGVDEDDDGNRAAGVTGRSGVTDWMNKKPVQDSKQPVDYEAEDTVRQWREVLGTVQDLSRLNQLMGAYKDVYPGARGLVRRMIYDYAVTKGWEYDTSSKTFRLADQEEGVLAAQEEGV
jgi:hypothetical protein